jgi:hypothetical protein
VQCNKSPKLCMREFYRFNGRRLPMSLPSLLSQNEQVEVSLADVLFEE